jgi:hypothetical protein
MDEVAIAAAIEEALESILTDFLPSVVGAIPVPVLDLAVVGGPTTSLGLAQVSVGLSGSHLTLMGRVAAR